MGMDVEVCLDIGSRTLSPFQRKVNMVDLLKAEESENDKLIQLLFRLGYDKQPFNLSAAQLQYPEVRDAIDCNGWNYVHNGGKNKSLKRVSTFVPYLPKPVIGMTCHVGSVIGGELYISELQNWWNHIQVRLRYDDTGTVFPVGYSDVPFRNNSGTWIKRNKEEENRLLLILRNYLDEFHSVLNLNANPDFIKVILQKEWSLFVPKDSKNKAKITPQVNKSGIEWFSIENNIADPISTGKILEAYLQNRNFVENNGIIQLFTPKSIERLSPDVVTKSLVSHLNVEKLYAFHEELDFTQKTIINQFISQKVNAVLKPYQMEGVYWLTQMRKKSIGCLLADDMGLGKTLQVLAYLSTFTQSNCKHLVVCPASLTSNWENEVVKFTPELLAQLDIASYEAVRIHPEQFNSEYDTLIIDEGQMVKNDHTQRHQAIYNLNRKHTIILSGTPIENSIREIWSQFQLLIPEIAEIERKILSLKFQSDTQRWCELSKTLLSPFILRRTKEEVLKNLPAISEYTIYIELTAKERGIYQSILTAFKTAIETGISGRINSIALEGLLRLRQCCVSVNMLPKHLSNSKNVKSSKMGATFELIERFINEGHQILVFSQFTSALDELKSYLCDNSISVLYLSGATRNRQSIVDAFQNSSQYKVFLISLRAGGTGLNLTAADRVIFLDDWWNPAVESQAFGRAHRIGQKNAVEVYRMVCKDTVEEKMLELHKNKKEISDLFNRGDGKLTIDEIKNLLI